MTRVVSLGAGLALAIALSSCPSSKPQSRVSPSASCSPSVDPLTGIKKEPLPECVRYFAASVRRQLDLPRLALGAPCPVSAMLTIHTERAPDGDYLVPGPGPAYPYFVAGQGSFRLHEVDRRPVAGWYIVKTLWWVDRREAGYILIRPLRLDGASEVKLTPSNPALGDRVTVGDEELGKESLFPTAREGSNVSGLGWRNFPGATAFREPGCYAFQVDGVTFSYLVIFKVLR